VRVDQPDPSRAQSEQIDDERERFAQSAIDVGGAVERFGDVFENAEVARRRATWPFTS
jgi:hypothetical protein